jgi:polyprenyl-phospho-N-acetylgalactosaminyl synthase
LKICLIIPAFNEAHIVKKVLEELVFLKYSIILVDDGSDDDTFHIASEYPITLLRHRINLGQGAALETGMEAARRMNADFVVHFDADGQHDPADVEQLLVPLQTEEADIVFGSRFLTREPTGISWPRKMILKTARWVNYFFTGILLTDAHNGLRALNKKALSMIHFQQPGMAHASEILYAVKNNSLRYKEIPVHIRYTPYSKKKGQGLLGAVNILFHLLFKRN